MTLEQLLDLSVNTFLNVAETTRTVPASKEYEAAVDRLYEVMLEANSTTKAEDLYKYLKDAYPNGFSNEAEALVGIEVEIKKLQNAARCMEVPSHAH